MLAPPRKPSSVEGAEALIEEARQRQRHRRVVVATIAALLIFTGTWLFVSHENGGHASRPLAPSAHGGLGSNPVTIDGRQRSHEITIQGFNGIAPMRDTQVMAAGAGSAWVMSWSRNTGGRTFQEVDRIDPTAGRVIAQIRVPNSLSALAYGDGALRGVWTGSGYGVTEIGTRTDGIIKNVTFAAHHHLPGSSVAAITVGDGDVYFAVGSVHDCTVDKLSAVSMRLVASWSLPSCSGAITQLSIAGGFLWTDGWSKLRGLNLQSGAFAREATLPPTFGSQSLAAAGGELWSAGTTSPSWGVYDGTLVELNPSTGHLLGVFNDGALAVAVDGEHLWYAYPSDRANSTEAFQMTPGGGDLSGDIAIGELDASAARTIGRFV